MNVPGFKVGLIIGKGGEMIKQMQEQSGAKIVIIQDSPEAAMEKPLRITGTPEAVEVAKSLVTDILNQTDERDSMYGGGGGGARGRGRGGGTMRGGRGGGFAGRGGFGAGRGGGRGGWYGGAGGGGGEYGGQATDYVQVPSNKVQKQKCGYKSNAHLIMFIVHLAVRFNHWKRGRDYQTHQSVNWSSLRSG